MTHSDELQRAFMAGFRYGCDYKEPPCGPPGIPSTPELAYKRFLKDTEGQDLVEYVLLIALIALAVSLAFPPVVVAITDVFTRAAAALGG